MSGYTGWRGEEGSENHQTMKDMYLRNPQFCQQCGSEEITAHQFFVDLTQASQAITCDDCGAEWHDLFTLTGYELVVDPS